MRKHHANSPTPARWVTRLLEWYCNPDLLEEIEGDLHEAFRERLVQHGIFRAQVLYFLDVVRFIRPFTLATKKKQYATASFVDRLSIHWKTAARSLVHDKSFSLLNLLGLSLGLAVSLVLLLYVNNELGYDRYHQKYEQLYQVWNTMKVEGTLVCGDRVPSPVASKMLETVPEVVQVARAFPQACWLTNQITSVKKPGYFADPAFLQLFTFRFLSGNPATALTQPGSVVLTESLARALFGKRDPLNQLLIFEQVKALKVTGVIEDLPQQSSLQFSFLVPWQLWEQKYGWKSEEEWGYYSFCTFVELSPKAVPERAEAKVKNLVTRFQPDQTHVSLFLHPMKKWHLYSEFKEGQNVGGHISYVRLFLGLAVGILLVACINFMNLSTARSGKRAREVGVRKVVGASRSSLIVQFLGEALLVSLLALGVCLLMVALLLPHFNRWLGTSLAIDYQSPYFWVFTLGFTFCTGLLAGGYPAFYLSSFRPVNVLKGSFRVGKSALSLRQLLVVVQFTFAIILIISTLLVYQQLRYIQNRPIGYQKAGLIQLSVEGKLKQLTDQFRQDLLESGAVVEACATSSPITDADSQTSIGWRGQRPEEKFVSFDQLEATHSVVGTLGLTLRQGRGFSRQLTTDTASVLLNETAVRLMGFKNPIGETITWQGEARQIVGIFADLVWDSPFEPARPMVIACSRTAASYYTLRLNPARPLMAALGQVESLYKRYNPLLPFQFSFVEEAFAQKLAFEKRLGLLANLFAVLAVLIACLGLLGLSAFSAEQRRREISIRKVLGASVPDVWLTLSREFIRLVGWSLLLASPVAYGAMHYWLGQYTYRTPISGWVFVLSGAVALTVALLTVSFHTVKAAIASPIRTIGRE